MEVVSRAIDASLFILETPLGIQLGVLQEVAEWAEVEVSQNREDRLVVEEGADLALLIYLDHLRRWDGILEEEVTTMHQSRARAGQ